LFHRDFASRSGRRLFRGAHEIASPFVSATDDGSMPN
jgi:hypothetical protein